MLCSLDTLSSGMFQDCALLKIVKMATTPNYIGAYCFYGCSSLEKINIPEGVEEIGYYAFYKCNKESIILPKSVTDISEAFDGSVKTVYYAGTEEEWNAVKKYKYDPIINANVIYNYQPDTPTDNLTFSFSADGTLKISGSGEMGAYEDQSGFGWYGLRNEIKTVIFDEGVTSIAAAAFKGYENLSEVILCGTITDIGASAFENCGNLKFVTFKSSPAVGDNAFKNSSELESVTVEAALNEIGYLAFYNCSRLKNIEFKKPVGTISRSAFNRCTALESIALPHGCIKICTYAFRTCKSLRKIVIPSSVDIIEPDAFLESPNVVIYCKKDSAAERYAIENGLKYKN